MAKKDLYDEIVRVAEILIRRYGGNDKNES